MTSIWLGVRNSFGLDGAIFVSSRLVCDRLNEALVSPLVPRSKLCSHRDQYDRFQTCKPHISVLDNAQSLLFFSIRAVSREYVHLFCVPQIAPPSPTFAGSPAQI